MYSVVLVERVSFHAGVWISLFQLCHSCVPPGVLGSPYLVLPPWVSLSHAISYVSVCFLSKGRIQPQAPTLLVAAQLVYRAPHKGPQKFHSGNFCTLSGMKWKNMTGSNVWFENWYLLDMKKFQATPTKQDLGNFGVFIKTFTTSNIVLLIWFPLLSGINQRSDVVFSTAGGRRIEWRTQFITYPVSLPTLHPKKSSRRNQSKIT